VGGNVNVQNVPNNLSSALGALDNVNMQSLLGQSCQLQNVRLIIIYIKLHFRAIVAITNVCFYVIFVIEILIKTYKGENCLHLNQINCLCQKIDYFKN
jgi:hypothetical protein